MAVRRHMSAIRSQAEVQALLGEGPGCAKSGHSLSLQRTTAPSPFLAFQTTESMAALCQQRASDVDTN
jgi:hypothetical protein